MTEYRASIFHRHQFLCIIAVSITKGIFQVLLYRTEADSSIRRIVITLERFRRAGACFALVRNFVVECVRPDRYLQRRDAYATVVYVSEVFKHLVLSIATWFQVRRAHTDHLAGRDIAKVFQYLSHTDHLTNPLLIAFVFQTLLKPTKHLFRQQDYSRFDPECRSSYSRNRLRRNLMTVVRQTLDHIVVAVLVRDEERPPQRAVVRIQAVLSEYLLIVVEIIVIYRTVECHYYHLRCLKWFQNERYYNVRKRILSVTCVAFNSC